MNHLVLGSLYIAYLFSTAIANATSGDNFAKRDVHSHYLPDFYQQALRNAGHLPGPDGMPAIPDFDPDVQLEFMKNQSIEKVYLSVSSPGVYLSVPSKEATRNATKLARQVNEYASKLKAKHPHQFGFFASLPLPDVNASIAEVKYCFEELDPKPDGVVLMSNAYGLYFGDPAMDPLYEVLNAFRVTIFEHPTGPCTEYNALKYHIDDEDTPMISQAEWRQMNRPVSTRQFATPTLDFPFDTARTFSDLFYSTVPDRFPELKWIMPHAGGGLLSTIAGCSRPSTELLRPWRIDSAISGLLRWVDYTRILFGTDTPFTTYLNADTAVQSFEENVVKVLDDVESQAVRRENAKKLFG